MAFSPMLDREIVFIQSVHFARVLSEGTGCNQDLYSSLDIQAILNLAVIVSICFQLFSSFLSVMKQSINNHYQRNIISTICIQPSYN